MTASSNDLELSGDDGQGAAESDNGQQITTDSRLLHSLTLRNLLSFSPENEPLELKALNVLIGPNGSGKSNLLEAIGLLRATPTDLRPLSSRGGGVGEWIWKGRPDEAAVIDMTIANQAGKTPLRHVFAFRSDNQTALMTNWLSSKARNGAKAIRNSFTCSISAVRL